MVANERFETLTLECPELPKRRSSALLERKNTSLPGLDFLFGLLYVASVGFLVRNRAGEFMRPRWYALYSVFSIVHTILAFYAMYIFAHYTTHFKENAPIASVGNGSSGGREHYNDSITLRLVFVCIATQFANAVLSKICTCLSNEQRRKYYTEMEAAYIDICGDDRRACLQIWLHLAISFVLHCAVCGIALSFTTMPEFQEVFGHSNAGSCWGLEFLPACRSLIALFAAYSAFSMSTVANCTPLVLGHSVCTLTEINRSLNRSLRTVTSGRHQRWWLTKDADLLLDRYRRLFRLYGDLKRLLSFRTFSQFSVTTLNLVITAYLHYMDTGGITDTKIRTISVNVFFFILLFWSAFEVHRMKTEAEVPVQLLSSSRYLPTDPQRLEELRMFIIMWQSQDVRVSGSGFFTVDLSLIVSIISTVVTYTVILVQVKTYGPCLTESFQRNFSC